MSFEYINKFDLKNEQFKECSSFIQNKVSTYISGLMEFCNAVVALDTTKVKELLEKGFPQNTNKYFNEDDIQEMGDNFFDLLDDEYYPNIPNLYVHLTQIPGHEDTLELIASYKLMQDTDRHFTPIYIAASKNKDNILEFIDICFKNRPYDHDKFWMLTRGALYQNDVEIYEKCRDYQLKISKTDEATTSHNISPLNDWASNYYSKVRDLNFDFWKDYFHHFIDYVKSDSLKRIAKHELPNQEEISYKKALYHILTPLRGAEYFGEENKEIFAKVSEFIHEEYNKTFHIKDEGFVLLDMTYNEMIILKRHEEDRVRINSMGVGRTPRVLRRQLNNKEEELIGIIKDLISKKPALECLQYFQQIDIPLEYYKEFKNYVELNENLNINPNKLKVRKV